MRAELYPSDVHILFLCDGTVLKKRFLFWMSHLTQGTTKRTPKLMVTKKMEMTFKGDGAWITNMILVKEVSTIQWGGDL